MSFVTPLLASVSILLRVQNWMSSPWGLFVLFGLLFSCGVGVPLPEDIPLIVAGYFIANGKMHLVLAAIAAWCGIIGGDCMLYMFGRRYGHNITRVPFIGGHVTEARLEWAEQKFAQYGSIVVAVGRLFAGIRGAMVLAAGTIRFSFIKFLIADGLAAIVSGGLFMALGYWAGTKLGDLESLSKKIKHYENYVLAGIILVIIVLVALNIWNQYRHRTVGQTIMEKAETLRQSRIHEKKKPADEDPKELEKEKTEEETTSTR